MKKVILGAIVACLAGCYTPLNNSGVSTTKPWLEVPGKRVDFDGKQYDSCVQFNLHFWPQEAAKRLDLRQSCISACCWRSEQSEIVLDFNKNFEQELYQYGVARKYSPGKITLKVTHSNLVNVTKVTTDPRAVIKNSGLVKLSYTTVRDEKRLAQLERQENQPMERQENQPNDIADASQTSGVSHVNRKKVQPAMPVKENACSGAQCAKRLVQQKVGSKIDAHFYQMNKIYQQKEVVFLLSDRILLPREQADGTYLVFCHAKARSGRDVSHLDSRDFPCGIWRVDTQSQTVEPYDVLAKRLGY